MEQPGQRQLGGGGSPRCGKRCKFPIAQQPRLLQRRVGHHRHVVGLAPGQQIPFDAAAGQVVEHLIDGAAFTFRLGEQGFHVPHVQVADAPVADLAGCPQAFEGFHCFIERDRAAPVQQVQIQAIHAEPLQAAFAGDGHRAPAGVVRIDFADEKDLVTAAANGFADQGLGGAFAVHLGGVDQRHAEADPVLQRGDLVGPARRVFAHHPGSHAQRGDVLSGG